MLKFYSTNKIFGKEVINTLWDKGYLNDIDNVN